VVLVFYMFAPAVIPYCPPPPLLHWNVLGRFKSVFVVFSCGENDKLDTLFVLVLGAHE